MVAKPVARLGDMGSHGGSIISGENRVLVNNVPVARVGDMYACPVHGPNPIITGCKWIFGDNLLVAHLGSKTACGATITSGSPDTFADDAVNAGGISLFFNMGTPPQIEITKKYDEQFRVLDKDGSAIRNIPYYIVDENNNIYEGFTDDDGCCERVYTSNPQKLTIYLGVEALERRVWHG